MHGTAMLSSTSRFSLRATASLMTQLSRSKALYSPCRRRIVSSSARTRRGGAAAPTRPATTSREASGLPRQVRSSTTVVVRHQSSSSSTATKNKATPLLPRIFQNKNALSTPRTWLDDMSFAQVAGHLGFLLSIYSFSQTNVLDLRSTMLGATACGTVFQYYRPVIDSRYQWQILLFGINAYMATNLYLERKEAENMSDELKQVYEVGDFASRGFNRVEFCKLFRKAEKLTFRKGRSLIREGIHPNVFFLIQGSIDVRKDDRTIARLEGDDEGHVFLGEMTLLDRLRSTTYEDAFASADAIVASDEVVVYEWKYDVMLPLLEKEHEVTNALLAYISFDLQDKLHLANSNQLKAFLAKKTNEMEQQKAIFADLSSRIEANEAKIRENFDRIETNDARIKANDARMLDRNDVKIINAENGEKKDI